MSADVHYDVIIAGAGIVGLTMASALKETGLKIAVVDRKAPEAVTDETSLRVSAINAASKSILEDIGVWDILPESRVSAYRHMHVWDVTGAGQIDFDGAKFGIEELGYIIENNVITAALMQSAESSENIDWLLENPIESIERAEQKQKIVLQDGSVLSCRLIIGADGANSLVRRSAAIEFIQKSYQQMGVVATVKSELPHQQTASQCFHPSGPLAFLPLADGRCSIVWSLDNDEAGAILSLDDEAFCKRLSEAFQYRYGDILEASQRAAFPLSHGHVTEYVQDGLALIGDAAHVIHPLAGQGANLGIMDARQLTQVIADAIEGDRQWYARHTLRRYERQRKGENLLMELSMSGFKSLFGNDDPVLSEVRNVGLNIVDGLPIIKNRFIQHALGLH